MMARTTRRGLLAGLAASSLAASNRLNASPESALDENPTLVALGDALPELSERHRTALDRKKQAYKEAMQVWPKPPEEISIWLRRAFGIHDIERDVAGAGFKECPERGHRHVITAKYISQRLEDAETSLQDERARKKPRKTRIDASQGCIDHHSELLPLAEAYEAECARIKSATQFGVISETACEATDELHQLLDQIMKEPAHTMLGVVIKAQALESWDRSEWMHRAFNVRGPIWAKQMAQAVISQGKSA